jgi:transcriptional regulator with XRE-family HTH domain
MQLDSFRTSQGWSLTKLAEEVGASHATVVRRWCLPHGHKDRLVPSACLYAKDR